MEVTRLYTDANGESNFELVPIIMEEQTEIGFSSVPETNVKSLRFQNVFAHDEWSFHISKNKTYIIILSGLVELEG